MKSVAMSRNRSENKTRAPLTSVSKKTFWLNTTNIRQQKTLSRNQLNKTPTLVLNPGVEYISAFNRKLGMLHTAMPSSISKLKELVVV